MYIFSSSHGLDRILLKDRGVASPAQIARAVLVGAFLALLFVYVVPGAHAAAGPAGPGVERSAG